MDLARAIKRRMSNGKFLRCCLELAIFLRRCLLGRHFKDHFQFDWSPERKARNAVHESAWVPFFSEYVLEKLRGGVSNRGMFSNVSRSCHVNT